MMAPLSTTSMTQQLKSSKFADFCETIETYLGNNPEDSDSACKVVKTVAWYFYENSAMQDVRPRIVDCVIRSVNIIRKLEKSASVVKDIVGSLYHITSRLQKVDKDVVLLAELVPVVHSLIDALPDPQQLSSLAYSFYGVLWNFTISLQSSVQKEEEALALIKIQHTSLLFQLVDPSSDKFSLTKLVTRVKSFASVFASNSLHSSSKELLWTNLAFMLQHPVLRDSGETVYWDLWTFSLDFAFKYDLTHASNELVSMQQTCADPGAGARDILGFLWEVKHLSAVQHNQISISLVESIASTQVQDKFLTAVLSILQSLLSSVGEELVKLLKLSGSGPVTVQLVERGLLILCRQAGSPATRAAACRILGILECIELSHTDTFINNRMEGVRELILCNETLFKQLDAPGGNQVQVASSLAKLTGNAYAVGCQLYMHKHLDTAAEFIKISCGWADRILELDPTSSVSIHFSRYKTLSDVEHLQCKYRECMSSVAQGLVYLVTSELQQQQINDKLLEMSKFWTSTRVKLMLHDPEKKNEVCEINIIKLLKEREAKSNSDAVLSRLLAWEIFCYRQSYQDTVDLRDTTVKCIETLLEVDRSVLNTALVLLEQTWIFWFGDNVEDLRNGAMYCKKAESILNNMDKIGEMYLGITQYLRFLCEHRLLQIQIINEMKEEAERKVVEGRREEDGLNRGNEEMEDDGRPIYEGLELDIQNKLADFLTQSSEAFCSYDYEDIGAWYSIKNLLDIQLAVALHLETFNRQSIRLLENILRLAERFQETDHVIMSSTKLLSLNSKDFQPCKEKLCELSRGIDDSRPNTHLIYSVSLSLAEMYLNNQRFQECEELLNTILNNPFIKVNSFKSNIIRAEASLLGSRVWYYSRRQVLPYTASLDVSPDPPTVSQQGPVELAVDALQLVCLCRKYYEEDIRVPGRQNSGLLWLKPRLEQLAYSTVQHLTRLHKHMSAPRELKAYLKYGIIFSQSHCLPLYTCSLLLGLAQTQLMCDDEEQAMVQLQGVTGVLGDLLTPTERSRVDRKEAEGENTISLPGDDNRAASPLLCRSVFQPPAFLEDADDCMCLDCSNPLLHLVILDYTNTQGRALLMSGEIKAGTTVLRILRRILPKLEKKYERAGELLGYDPILHGRTFQEHVTEGLLLESESLAFCGEFEDAVRVIESIHLPLAVHQYPSSTQRTQHSSASFPVPPWMEVYCPTLVFRCLETRASLLALTQAEGVEEGVDSLIKGTQLLSIANRFHQFQGQATPTSARKIAKTSKAPSKRELPSLGVGDASAVAKDLEKLEIYSADFDDSPKLKPRRVGQTKHRLVKIEDLIDIEGRDEAHSKAIVKPKIVLTVDTPRKFFKSKGSDSTPAKTASAIMEHKSAKKLGVKPTRSGYQIYEDFEDGETLATRTPAKPSEIPPSTGGSAKRPSRSTRKKGTESAVKIAAMEEPPVRSTRKTAKRL